MCLQYKSFENTVGKGEIAHNEKCFSTMFSKDLYWNKTCKNKRLFGKRLLANADTLIYVVPILTLSQTTNFRLFQTQSVCRRQFQT